MAVAIMDKNVIVGYTKYNIVKGKEYNNDKLINTFPDLFMLSETLKEDVNIELNDELLIDDSSNINIEVKDIEIEDISTFKTKRDLLDYAYDLGIELDITKTKKEMYKTLLESK